MTSYFSRARSGALALVLALSLAVVALVSGGSPAWADTGGNSISHVFINLPSGPGPTAQSEYRAFLQSIQNAAGHPFRGSVFQTQGPSNAMIAADITSSTGHRVRLLLTPDNLYVRGFIAQNGVVWMFNPGNDPYNVNANIIALENNGADTSLVGGITARQLVLPFGSDYNSMVQAAGRGRTEMTIGWNDLNGSVNQLATYNGGDTQATARSLMFMTQFVSEATRINQVRGAILALTLSTFNPPTLFLPTNDLSLENNWGALSQYAVDVTNNSTIAPRTIGAAGTLRNFGQVATFLSTMLGVPAESTGNQGHDEL